MHHIRGFIAYIINLCFISNHRAIGLSYVLKNGELNFDNYPVNIPIVNSSDNNNFYQQNNINDPGYTKQNENVNSINATLYEKVINIANPRNFPQFVNSNSKMFHVLYMTPSSNSGQQVPINQKRMEFQTQPINNNPNLAYAGPHLFPIQQHYNYGNGLQSNMPVNSIKSLSNNLYNQQSYIKDSRVATKMEAPFIPSQFLGYGQQQFSQPIQHHQMPHQHQFINSRQHQQLPQQNQQFLQFPQQYQHMSEQNQQLTHQSQQLSQQPIRLQLNPDIKPVHEDYQVSSY